MRPARLLPGFADLACSTGIDAHVARARLPELRTMDAAPPRRRAPTLKLRRRAQRVVHTGLDHSMGDCPLGRRHLLASRRLVWSP
ncbi:hypothetical protein [Streptomyces sp. GbtcB6]|uniref:hypothetical protein n=1 Tax=Streptomyces sp. GbtcB6 TaxID=2824751 RepID=UPI001C2FB461|nr:hypothetical protein [Streptomyces sp. GbtcB6]